MSEAVLIFEGMPDLLPMLNRSKGVHVSEVINDLCLRLGHYAKREGDDPQTMWELGNALEHAIIARYQLDQPDRYVQPGELELDGKYGTPDLLDVVEMVLHEIKLTWMSTKHGPDSEKFWRYWVQLMAYCHMFGVRTGRLHVCHVMGDYRGAPEPIYRCWERTFDDYELAENWAKLTTHSELMTREAGTR